MTACGALFCLTSILLLLIFAGRQKTLLVRRAGCYRVLLLIFDSRGVLFTARGEQLELGDGVTVGLLLVVMLLLPYLVVLCAS